MIYYGTQMFFEGDCLNGEVTGKGKQYYPDGKLNFEGEYVNGYIWNGKSYEKESNKEFEIKDGKGKGKEYFNNGKLFFEGEYLNGERNGKGKEYNDNGKLAYEGEYLN